MSTSTGRRAPPGCATVCAISALVVGFGSFDDTPEIRNVVIGGASHR